MQYVYFAFDTCAISDLFVKASASAAKVQIITDFENDNRVAGQV